MLYKVIIDHLKRDFNISCQPEELAVLKVYDKYRSDTVPAQELIDYMMGHAVYNNLNKQLRVLEEISELTQSMNDSAHHLQDAQDAREVLLNELRAKQGVARL